MRRSLVGIAAAAALAAATGLGLEAQPRGTNGQWRSVGGDAAFTRYSPLDQINKNNVKTLKVAWRQAGYDPALKQAFPTLRVSGNYRSTPIMVDGVLYAPNAVGLIRAFGPGSGEIRWEQAPFAQTIEEVSRPSPRGVDYWKSGSDERLFLVRGEYLYAINAKDGSYIQDFGEKGRVNLHWSHPLAGLFSWTASPIVVNDVIVVAGATAGAGDGGVKREAAPEDVRGFDARTGKLLWTFHVVPPAGEYGSETWGGESNAYSGDLASWCCISGDAELGQAYVPLSAPTGINYGGHRPGDNLFSDSIVALDVKTGKRVWHFQMVHHDLWDYDTVGPATLGDITVNGKRIKALMQPSKTGFMYVFDRTTGTAGVADSRSGRCRSRRCRARSRRGRSPSPPSRRRSIARAGPRTTSSTTRRSCGPAPRRRSRTSRWARSSRRPWSPATSRVAPRASSPCRAAGARATGTPARSTPRPGSTTPCRTPSRASAGRSRPTTRTRPWTTRPRRVSGARADPPPPVPWPGPDLSIDGFPIFKGPYGRITAIDMNRGEHVWMAANGDGPRNHPLVKDLKLPPLGIPGRGAPLLTKTLLFIGEGSDALPGTNRDGMFGRMFRAYDKATGAVVWETELPAGTTGAPITYMHQGKQYIVIAIGGREQLPEFVAFALP